MANDATVYNVDINFRKLTVKCSCGRLALTFTHEPTATEAHEMAATIQRHKEAYPDEEHAWIVDIAASSMQTEHVIQQEREPVADDHTHDWQATEPRWQTTSDGGGIKWHRTRCKVCGVIWEHA